MNTLSPALDLLLPRACLVCRRAIKIGELCRFCEFPGTLAPWERCSWCHTALPLPVEEPICPACRRAPLLYSGLRYLWEYDFRVKGIIQAMKYHPSYRIASLLSQILAESASELYPHASWDYILPIPSRRSSFRKRGFQPTLLFANAIKQSLTGNPLHYFERGLLRTRQSSLPQARLPVQRRARNIKNSFFVSQEAEISHKTILLVDDVITTGATCHYATKALLIAGASRVDVIAAACSEVFSKHRFTRIQNRSKRS